MTALSQKVFYSVQKLLFGNRLVVVHLVVNSIISERSVLYNEVSNKKCYPIRFAVLFWGSCFNEIPNLYYIGKISAMPLKMLLFKNNDDSFDR